MSNTGFDMTRKEPTEAQRRTIKAAKVHVMQLEKALAEAKRRLFEAQIAVYRDGVTSDDIRDMLREDLTCSDTTSWD